MKKKLTVSEIDRIVEMAWEDRTPFDAIEKQFGLSHKETIKLMRKEMKESSFKMWRKRMSGRKTKHSISRPDEIDRFQCARQPRMHRNISKR
jgi:uncharacterized protein (TIGR03643 family)